MFDSVVKCGCVRGGSSNQGCNGGQGAKRRVQRADLCFVIHRVLVRNNSLLHRQQPPVDLNHRCGLGSETRHPDLLPRNSERVTRPDTCGACPQLSAPATSPTCRHRAAAGALEAAPPWIAALLAEVEALAHLLQATLSGHRWASSLPAAGAPTVEGQRHEEDTRCEGRQIPAVPVVGEEVKGKFPTLLTAATDHRRSEDTRTSTHHEPASVTAASCAARRLL